MNGQIVVRPVAGTTADYRVDAECNGRTATLAFYWADRLGLEGQPDAVARMANDYAHEVGTVLGVAYVLEL